MKTRLAMKTALVLGLPALARDLGRAQRWRNAVLDGAGNKVGRGKVASAAVLAALYCLSGT